MGSWGKLAYRFGDPNIIASWTRSRTLRNRCFTRLPNCSALAVSKHLAPRNSPGTYVIGDKGPPSNKKCRPLEGASAIPTQHGTIGDRLDCQTSLCPAARILHISKAMAYRLIQQGALPAVRINHAIRISRAIWISSFVVAERRRRRTKASPRTPKTPTEGQAVSPGLEEGMQDSRLRQVF